MNIWEAIKDYYMALGEKYSVDPVIFLGVHVVATPPFLAGVWWIVRNKKRNKSIIMPVLLTLFFSMPPTCTLLSMAKISPGGFIPLLVL